MDRETWQRLSALFDAAVARPAAERPGFVDQACAGQPELRAELEALLAAHAEDPDHDLASPLGALAPALVGDLAPVAAPDLSGLRLGAYELRDLIGHGGMADVYRAVRADREYEREVAVKLVKPGLRLDQVAHRFRVERQILARLEHPNIAALLDGGVTPDGRPYLVMPYVQGRPITAYAEGAGLDPRRRVALLRTVCEAVQFAHANLVVHRDLKPSNILVTDAGEVRLLDFGIAKLLDPAGLDLTLAVTGDARLLTPEYAAPEQLRGEAITTATDVHALGVLLYELLTGRRPYRGDTLLTLQRSICEDAPLRPGTVSRQPLDPDLDAIVMMALRKEPSRRYASAGQLGDDLGRYLSGQPVLARPDTVGYRLRKFLARNRLAVATAVLVAACLVGATVFSAGQAAARARALATAEAEREKAEQLSTFLIDVFAGSEPGRGGEVTARQLLDAGAERIGFTLDTRPEVQAAMARAIGQAYGALGYYDQADSLLSRALRASRASLPDNHPDLLSALQLKGALEGARGHYAAAAAILDSVLARRLAARPSDPDGTADLLETMAGLDTQRGEYDRARAELDRARELLTARYGPDDRRLVRIWRGYGKLAAELRENEAALGYHRRALALWPDSLGHDHPDYYDLLESVALSLSNVGQVDSALVAHREILAGRERIFGPDHPTVAYSHHNLGRTLAQLGDHAGAIPHYQRAIAIREAAFGPDHPVVAHALESLAIARFMTGDAEDCESLLRRTFKIYEAALGPRHRETIETMTNLAYLYHATNRPEDSLDWLERAADAGWRDLAAVAGYPDLAGRPRYERLLRLMREAAGPESAVPDRP
ncbi:MAG: serine/threonine-protein kinase [Candidatus Krumholzibacteriia bacterium]